MSIHHLLRVVFYFIFLWLPALPSQAAKTSIPKSKLDMMVEDAAGPWSNPDGTGFANDVVRAAYREMGVDLNLQVVPYARCKYHALNGDVVACFSMTWLPSFKNKIQLASVPLIILNADVFENSADPLPRPQKESCSLPDNTTVGIVNEYEYPDHVMELLKRGLQVIRTRNDTQSLQMLSLGRIDAAIITTNDLQPRNTKAKAAQVADRVRLAFNCGHQTGTIGFSLLHPKGRWAHQIFQEGYNRIRQNGVLEKIRKKWFD